MRSRNPGQCFLRFSKSGKSCTLFRAVKCPLDEITDVSTKEQLSIILIFDKKGEIVERFIKFANVGSDRTALAISDISRDLLNGFGE